MDNRTDQKGGSMENRGNAIIVIKPYRYEGSWVFDDEQVGLSREPFVSGIPEIIDHFVRDIPNAEAGFRMLFSATPFPGYQVTLTLVRPEFGGNWYRCEELDQEGWLCPALFRYFDEAPKTIYAKVEAIQS